MSDCPDCTKARAGTWGMFAMGCQSCAARHIARSPAAWEALSAGGDRAELSAMVDHIMGAKDRAEGVRLVREWFKLSKEKA